MIGAHVAAVIGRLVDADENLDWRIAIPAEAVPLGGLCLFDGQVVSRDMGRIHQGQCRRLGRGVNFGTELAYPARDRDIFLNSYTVSAMPTRVKTKQNMPA